MRAISPWSVKMGSGLTPAGTLSPHGVPPREQLRELRAVEALEWAGGEAAVEALRALAAGAEESRLTREARAALARQRP